MRSRSSHRNAAAWAPSTMRWSNAHVSDHRRPRHDFPSTDDGPRLQRAHPENRRLRVVDHRHTVVEPQRAEVGHRERGALQFGGLERAGAGIPDQLGRPRRPTRRVVLSCASADDGHQQSARGRDTESQMHRRCRWICGPFRGVDPRRVEHFGCASAIVKQPQGQHERRDTATVRRPGRASGRAAQQARAVDLHTGMGIRYLPARQRHSIAPSRACTRSPAPYRASSRRRVLLGRPTDPAAASTSSRVITPSAPDPASLRGRRFSSAASFRTGGFARGRSDDRRRASPLLLSISSSAP